MTANKCNIKWSIVMTVFLSLLSSQSLLSNNDCLNYLKNVSKQYIQTPDKKKVFYVHYSTTTKMNNKNYSLSSTEVKLYGNANLQIVKSDQMDVYQDDKAQYIINPQSKAIYINDMDRSKQSTHQLEMFTSLLDTLFSNCTVIECTKMIKDKKTLKKIVVEVSEKIAFPLGKSKISYFVDDNSRKLAEVIIDYPKGYAISYIHLKIFDISFDFRTKLFEKPMHSYIFDSQDKPKGSYLNFKIIDTRINK